jgi:nitroreductase
MADAAELHENIQEAHEKSGTKWIGVYIAILAVLLAITGMGGSNSMKDMINANVEVTNYWSFFQAKNVRQSQFRLAADQLEIDLAANPTMPDAARKNIETKIKRYRETVERYESDPKEGDGKKQLMAKARSLEAERAKAQRRDPYFDFAEALIQIAIVLASVTIITGARPLLFGSLGVGLLGALLMINGFTLWVTIGLLEH